MATYLVTREGAVEGEKPRMVEARTQASAVAHVARTEYKAEPISTKQAVDWAKRGVDLEDPKDEGKPEQAEAE